MSGGSDEDMPSTTATFPLEIRPNVCVECAACVPVCAFDAIFLRGWGIEIIEDSCTLCGVCVQVCPTGALIDHDN